MFDAATCSPVWITINGTRGSIVNKYLEIAENESFPFEPNNRDLFILYDIDIGELNKLILGHENGNAEQGWFVESIAIHIPSKQYQSEIYEINKWLNSKRIDSAPLIEIQIRKPMKLNRNIKHQQATLPKLMSNTIIHSVPEYESSYTIYILTEDFQSDLIKQNVFIDLINETMSTNYMRLNSKIEIRENLERNVLGQFNAYGSQIGKINRIRLLIRMSNRKFHRKKIIYFLIQGTPDQITRWLPRSILIIIDDSQQIFKFKSSHCIIHSNANSNLTLSMELEETQNTKQLDNIENQLENLKNDYTNETRKIVIDKRNSETYNK
ncbi:unnamed protein product [Rotaria magnacalcarata]|nr:unnamed protein product [Rotaria magnacalcarata]